MFTKHNALFCCREFLEAYRNGTDTEHECAKNPVYVVEGEEQ